MTVRLIPLDCPACGSAMTGGTGDSVFLCTHCGGGAVLESERLVPVAATALLPAPGRRAERWLPGWMLETGATIAGRITSDSRMSPPVTVRRRFVVPAFPLPLADLTRLSRALTAVADAVGEVPHEPLPGGRLGLEDALTLVRHLVIGEEAARPDMLASVEVTLTPREHRLIALPFERDGDRLRCAATGVSVAPEA